MIVKVHCPICGSTDVKRLRVTVEAIDMFTNTISRADAPTWTDDYECACGAEWNEWARIAR